VIIGAFQMKKYEFDEVEESNCYKNCLPIVYAEQSETFKSDLLSNEAVSIKFSDAFLNI